VNHEQRAAEFSRQLAAERDYSKELEKLTAEARARTAQLTAAIEAVLSNVNMPHAVVRDILRPAVESYGLPKRPVDSTHQTKEGR
jgi:hypothetical protein